MIRGLHRGPVAPAFRTLLVLLALGAGTEACAAIRQSGDWRRDRSWSLTGRRWRLAFRREKGEITFTVKDQKVEISPLATGAGAGVLRTAETSVDPRGGRAVANTVFRTRTGKETTLRIEVWEGGAMRVEPGTGASGLRLSADIGVGVLPGIRLEDVFYRPWDFRGPRPVHVPAENWFAGLLAGENGLLACAWPAGDARLRLLRSRGQQVDAFLGVELATGGSPVYLEVIAAPAVWHREILAPDMLEKDVRTAWKRPFAATYRTLVPLKAETTTLRAQEVSGKPRSQWLPEVGNISWPLRFEDNRAVLHYSKKIPPQGDMIAYPAHGGEQTLRACLARTPFADMVTARNKRSPIPDGPRGVPNVGYNACWGTHMLRRTLYVEGVQHREKEFLGEQADYLGERVAMVQLRNKLYGEFFERTGARLTAWLDETADEPVRAYLTAMQAHLERAMEGHRRKMDRCGDATWQEHTAHARRNVERLKRLLATPGQELYPECEALIDELNRLSWGHDEETGMRFNMLARAWALEAATSCARVAEAVPHAVALRAALREVLNRAAPWW